MVSFFNFHIMSLNKRKKHVEIVKNWLKRGFYLGILAAFLVGTAVPVVLLAKNDEKGYNFAYLSQKSFFNVSENTLVIKQTRGIKPRIAVLQDDSNPSRVVRAVITAYTSTPDQTDDTPFIAASGKRVYDGMIAANWLPFGTKVKIPSVYGEKEFTVDDRMNARYGFGYMDVWLDSSKSEAFQFGIKVVDVEVYYAPPVQLSRLGR